MGRLAIFSILIVLLGEFFWVEFLGEPCYLMHTASVTTFQNCTYIHSQTPEVKQTIAEPKVERIPGMQALVPCKISIHGVDHIYLIIPVCDMG